MSFNLLPSKKQEEPQISRRWFFTLPVVVISLRGRFFRWTAGSPFREILFTYSYVPNRQFQKFPEAFSPIGQPKASSPIAVRVVNPCEFSGATGARSSFCANSSGIPGEAGAEGLHPKGRTAAKATWSHGAGHTLCGTADEEGELSVQP